MEYVLPFGAVSSCGGAAVAARKITVLSSTFADNYCSIPGIYDSSHFSKVRRLRFAVEGLYLLPLFRRFRVLFYEDQQVHTLAQPG